MNRSLLRRHRCALILAAAGAVPPVSSTLHAAVSASIVPGTLTQGTVKASLTGGSYASESNNLGDWPLNTGGTSTVFPVTLTNADFNGSAFGGTPNTIVAFGNGGGVTLKFATPVKPLAGAKEFGIFTAQMLLTSNGSLFNGNMEAAILVSADNVIWHTLTGESVASPTTYTATSYKLNAPAVAYNYGNTREAWSGGSGVSAATLAALSVANFQTPMPSDDLFNGAGTDADRLALGADASAAYYNAIFGTSGGGNWFDISAAGLADVQYLRLNGVNVPASGGVRLDSVFANADAVPEPAGLAVVGMSGLLLMRRKRRAG